MRRNYLNNTYRKNLIIYLKFFGMILLYPFISALFVLIIGHIVKNPLNINRHLGVIPFILFIVIFYKSVKFNQSFHSISVKSFIQALVITVLLYFVCGVIEMSNRDLSTISKSNISPIRLLFFLGFTPVLEEICCRVIIINHFRDKINDWVLIFVTAFYFTVIHFGNIYISSSMLLFGLVLAKLYFLTGNATLIILVHFLYNLLSFLQNDLLFNFTKRIAFLYHSPLLIMLAGIVLLMLSLLFIKKPAMVIRTYLNKNKT